MVLYTLLGDNHEDCEGEVVGGKVKESTERIDKKMESFKKDGKDDQDDGPRCSVTKHSLSQELVGVEIPADGSILLQGDNHGDCKGEVVGVKVKGSTERIDKVKEHVQKDGKKKMKQSKKAGKRNQGPNIDYWLSCGIGWKEKRRK